MTNKLVGFAVPAHVNTPGLLYVFANQPVAEVLATEAARVLVCVYGFEDLQFPRS